MLSSHTLEIWLLLISTIPAPFFLFPLTASFIFHVKNSDSHDSGLDLFLSFLIKAFVLRCSLIFGTLLHEASHLIAAVTECDQPFETLFSMRNLMGSVECGVWLKALCPIVQWPNAACTAHVKLPFQPSAAAHVRIRCAGPSASLILAVACSAVAWLIGSSSVLTTFAAGTWMIAIGGITSDILVAASDITKFRCGNFGMLVICVMDRCAAYTFLLGSQN
jgi:hypothetical protein